MDKATLVKTCNSKGNGQFMGIEYQGDLFGKVSASAKKNGIYSVTKITKAVVRKGIDYDNQKSVQEKVENGKVLTHELPWGEWSDIEEEKDLIIYHKGKTYVRLYFGTNEGISKPKTEYFVNGILTAYEDLKAIMQGSFFKDSEKPDCITLNIENVIAIK